MKKIYLFLFFLTTLSITTLYAQQPAFPGAEGAGRFTSGGRGGAVYAVTNLNDSGPGSLRQGVEMSGARTIVFRVSGTIALENDLRIRNGNLTIAGQTAPGDGIAIKGGGVILDADNIIIRYIRFRPGDISGRELDALWGREQKDIIIDHCSMSWATDETGSFYDNENFTLQWCILSESLYESVHGKGAHGYGGIWGGKGASFHHNLLAHHSSRNPRFNGARYTTTKETEIVDFRNNVIYNWGGNSAYGGEGGNHNLVANYYKSGPATQSGEKQYRIVDASSHSTDALGRWYVTDNYVAGYPEVSADNWDGGVQRLSAEQLEIVRVDEPFPVASVATQTAEEAYMTVLAEAGANYPRRDPVDARIVEEVESGSATFGGKYGAAKGIIDTQETVGGWPELMSAPAPEDADQDGMADEWELANGLNPADPEDRNSDVNGNGYTNLEDYLNSLLETEAPDFLRYPTAITVQQSTSNSISLSWTNISGQETETILERSNDGNDFTEIARLEPHISEYKDEELEAGKTYYYRLMAVSETAQSAYSEVLSANTNAVPVAPEADGLVGYWSLDHSSGTDVEDGSIYLNHGTLENAGEEMWASGKRYNALDLETATAETHLRIPHAEQLDFDETSFSVSFWMNAADLTSQAYLFQKGSFVRSESAGTTGRWYGLEFKENLIRFAVDDDVTKSEVSTSGSEFTNGEWVHVVLVRNTATKMLSIYRNGELVTEAADRTNNGIGQEQDLIIGNSSDLDVPFRGMIDEFKLYNYALKHSEISGLYTQLPMQAINPNPANEATNIDPEELVLGWSGDAAAYNVYVGTSSASLELVSEGMEEASYAVSGLEGATEYFWRVDAVGPNEEVAGGETWTFRTAEVTGVADVASLVFFNCFPNPFSRQLSIEFELLKREEVALSIYDMHNRLLHTVVNSTLEAGVHRFRLDAAKGSAVDIEEGIYLCVFRTPESKLVKRLLYLKQ